MHTGATRIVDIIAAIDSIAFRTNLLALDAAVEGARAGEYAERRTRRHGAADKTSSDLISRRRSTSLASVCAARSKHSRARPASGQNMDAERAREVSMRREGPSGRLLAFAFVLACSSPVAAQTSLVDVIEYYNATLDHYFISALPADITALDSGRFAGWARTGKKFGAYPSAAPGASPVCRFYLPPQNGDSHFYSASPGECDEVKAKFPSLVYESATVMYIGLPDAATGACGTGLVPVYRLWNKRADSNHRYTTERTTRDAMIAKGYVPEGYGPDGVAMCSPSSEVAPAITRKDAARFLRQATFGAPREAIDALVAQGYEAWLAEQFAMPAVSHVTTTLAHPEVMNGPMRPVQYSAWKQRFEGQDQLRQRVSDALLQIYVVSMYLNKLRTQATCALASYLDVLNRDAFGNFRDLLKDVTLSPAMGEYLSMKGSGKADPVLQTQPDENYAREVMQLFTVGLVMLNEDGTAQFGPDGKPLPAFNEDTVKGFARALSGWTTAMDQSGPYRWLGDPYFPDPDPKVAFQLTCDAWSKPMVPWLAAYKSADNTRIIPGPAHDQDAKQLLVYPGAPYSTLPAGQTPQADLENVLDNLFHHPNVGPFIGKQLIQRLVTSNPSPAYVQRVARKFNDNGSGVRGDMKAVIRAILLDDEARNLVVARQPTFGKLTEPVVRFVQYFRSFASVASSYDLPWELDTPGSLNQHPLKAPSVFNFYSPDYSPAGPMAQANLVGPEFEITYASSVAGFGNFSQCWIPGWGSSGCVGNTDVKIMPNFSYYLGLAGSPGTLIDELDMLLCAACLNPTVKAQIVQSVGAVATGNSYFGYSVAQERVHTALWLIINSPDYLVQK
jgi:uncharacterized protein (DUF1800 family)